MLARSRHTIGPALPDARGAKRGLSLSKANIAPFDRHAFRSPRASGEQAVCARASQDLQARSSASGAKSRIVVDPQGHQAAEVGGEAVVFVGRVGLADCFDQQVVELGRGDPGVDQFG